MRRCAREFHRLEDCEQASKWSGSKKKIDASVAWERKKKKAGEPVDFVLMPPIHDKQILVS